MTPADFTVWLRGFMAALGSGPMTAAQAETVRVELAKVAPAFPWTLQITAPAPAPFIPYVPPPQPEIQPWLDPTRIWYGPVGGTVAGGGAGLSTVCGGTIGMASGWGGAGTFHIDVKS